MQMNTVTEINGVPNVKGKAWTGYYAGSKMMIPNSKFVFVNYEVYKKSTHYRSSNYTNTRPLVSAICGSSELLIGTRA